MLERHVITLSGEHEYQADLIADVLNYLIPTINRLTDPKNPLKFAIRPTMTQGKVEIGYEKPESE